MTEEIWRDIDGYDGKYQVSNFGRVKSFKYCREGRLLKASLKSGYPFVQFGKRGKQVCIHRLVAKAFIPNPDSKPEVNHIDGNPLNNHVDNLEWCTRAENQRHAFATGLQIAVQGEDVHNAKLKNTDAQYIRDNPDGLTVKALAAKFAVSESTIAEIQLGKRYRDAGGSVRETKCHRIPCSVRDEIRRLYKRGVRGCSAPALAKNLA